MRGHLEKRHKSGWTIIIEAGRDPQTGKRRRIVRGFQGNKKAAEEEMRRLMGELERGSPLIPGKLTMQEFLEAWFESHSENLAASTAASYRRIIHRHLVPALGQIPLTKLQPLHIQSYHTHVLRAGRLNGPGGLSARTGQYHHAVLREALQQAVRWQLIPRNPADAVRAPRPKRAETRVLAADEVRQLLESAVGQRDYELIVTALGTGARQGELLALRWRDVDLEARTMTISRSLQRVDGQYLIKDTKTRKGRRSIPLPAQVVEMLRALKTTQAGDQDGLIFNNNGRPVNAGNLSHRFGNLARRTGLMGLRFHDLRHTHASLLLQAGVHPKVVQERLGHETISVTLDTYSHVLPGLQEAAVTKLENALGTDWAPIGPRQ